MLKSMTGFGNAVCNLPDKKINIELKSLNSKQLDLFLRLPGEYNCKEVEIRNLISQKTQRGKIYFSMTKEAYSNGASSIINHPLAASYYAELKLIENELRIPDASTDYLSIILRMPEIFNGNALLVSDEEWVAVCNSIEDCFVEFDAFRGREGKQTETELRQRLASILEHLANVETSEISRFEQIKEKLLKDIYTHIEEDKIDKNRFEQELIYYLDRIDISEEKSRLKEHCHYFLQTLNETESGGKKLGFICQEMGREINTLGSKANHATIQRLVVNMKDELEKIKEQLMNIL